MSLRGLHLFDLLPAVYRIRDAQIAQSLTLLTPAEAAQLTSLQALTPPLAPNNQALLDQLTAKSTRGPLQSLLMLIEEQLAVVSEDLDQLYDDQFIETCAPWVIPYIGDLIGYQAINGIPATVDDPRSEVANTISFRRRKGTVLVMEQLARDVTAWGAHAVEFFRYLADTQYMNHIRPANFYAPDLRRWQPGIYMDTAFDRTAHKVDVRRIASSRGLYNIQNIGIFLWSLNAYSVTATVATPAPGVAGSSAGCFRFSPLGIDIPLFHKATPQAGEITALAGPVNVPDFLRRRVLCADIRSGAGASYFGQGDSLSIVVDGQPLTPFQVRVCNLVGPDGAWFNVGDAVSPYAALVDPELGRLVITPSSPGQTPPAPTVSYFYGFNADMGGGEYTRNLDPDEFIVTDSAFVFEYPDPNTAQPHYHTLQEAVFYAIAQLTATNNQVAIEFAGTQTVPVTSSLTIDLPVNSTLEIRAADSTQATLLLGGPIIATGSATATAGSSLALNGLIIGDATAAGPLVHAPLDKADKSLNALGRLSITHCTLLPGCAVDSQGDPPNPAQPTIIVEPSDLQVTIEKSIVGGIQSNLLVTVVATNSIIDATSRTAVAYAALNALAAGGPLTLENCTVIGKIHAAELTLVTNCILWAEPALNDSWSNPLIADRKQAGCIRFSFLPVNSVIPRHYECVQEGPTSAEPLFAAVRYGRPGYCKLLASTSDTIRRGADNAGEMGSFNFLLAPLREEDLRIRMQEYIPVNLEFGIFYQT